MRIQEAQKHTDLDPNADPYPEHCYKGTGTVLRYIFFYMFWIQFPISVTKIEPFLRIFIWLIDITPVVPVPVIMFGMLMQDMCMFVAINPPGCPWHTDESSIRNSG